MRVFIIYLHLESLQSFICLPSGSGGQPLAAVKQTAGLHGISTRGVYPCHLLPKSSVRSYRTFSPLPH